MGYKAAFYTLGCRVNQYETRAMEEAFEKEGFTIGDFSEKCDVYVINTCTVTAESDRKSRQMIRRARKNGGESAVILKELLPEVRGAVIVCGGADNPSVKSDVIAAAVALLGVPSNNICVIKKR